MVESKNSDAEIVGAVWPNFLNPEISGDSLGVPAIVVTGNDDVTGEMVGEKTEVL